MHVYKLASPWNQPWVGLSSLSSGNPADLDPEIRKLRVRSTSSTNRGRLMRADRVPLTPCACAAISYTPSTPGSPIWAHR